MLSLLLLGCGSPSPLVPGDEVNAADSGADSGAGTVDSAPPDTGADSTSADTGPADTADTGPDDEQVGPPLDTLVVWALRHAEKEEDGDDPPLTAEGAARAEALVPVMAEEPLSAIYATDLQRTQLTVEPTALDHGLPVLVDAEAEAEFAAFLVATHPGETILHCGHSYTLPDLFEALGLDPVPEVSDYGQLWRIVLGSDGSVTYTETYFGE